MFVLIENTEKIESPPQCINVRALDFVGNEYIQQYFSSNFNYNKLFNVSHHVLFTAKTDTYI